MGKDVKHEVCSRAAEFLRRMDASELKPHYVDGKCVFCGALDDEIHEATCPMYAEEGLRQALNFLFFGIKSKEERAEHKHAF